MKAERYIDHQKKHEADFFYQLSILHSKFNHNGHTFLYAKKALELFLQENNFPKCIVCYIVLGVTNNRLRFYEQAESCFNKALEISNMLNNSRFLGMIYHNMGYLYSCMEEPNKAIEYYHLSLNVKEENGDPSIANTYYYLAKVYQDKQSMEQALGMVKKGLCIAKDNKSVYYNLKMLKYILLKNDHSPSDTQTFLSYLENEIIPYFKKNGELNDLCIAWELAADIYSSLHHHKKANHFLSLQLEYLK